MARLTKDQWAEARIKWESDPTLTFENLCKSARVDGQFQPALGF